MGARFLAEFLFIFKNGYLKEITNLNLNWTIHTKQSSELDLNYICYPIDTINQRLK